MARMVGLSNGGMVEWQRATRMAGMSTYLLFYGTLQQRHRRRHLLIFYSIDSQSYTQTGVLFKL